MGKHEEEELTVETVLRKLRGSDHWSEDRTQEAYWVAQLLAAGIGNKAELVEVGKCFKEMLERDEWARSNGAFNDE
jgi:hypothetical protein